MKIERLSGPSTHIGWTPDAVPKGERELVVLVRAADLAALEERYADVVAEWRRAVSRLESAVGAADNAHRVIQGYHLRARDDLDRLEAARG